MNLIGIRFYIPLELACSLFVAYCHEILNRGSYDGLVAPVERELWKSPIWLINQWKELREFALFIKSFVITMNTLERITTFRGIESDLAHTKVSGVASQYILWSESLWYPAKSNIHKNKCIFSLVISKLISALSTVQIDAAKNYIN